jgi:hypothetical protein
MSAIDDAFSDLAEQVAEQLSDCTITVVRRVPGAFNAATGTEAAGTTPTATAIAALRRGAEREEGIGGSGTGRTDVEQVEYVVKRSTLLAASGWDAAEPDERCTVLEVSGSGGQGGAGAGDGVTRRLVEVRRECHGTMLVLVCRAIV